MDQPILGLDGEPLMEGDTIFRLRDVVQRAIMQPVPSDQGRSGDEKARLMQLGLRANKKSADFRVEDIALLKSRIGEVFAPLVVGRAYELLDPTSGDTDDNV